LSADDRPVSGGFKQGGTDEALPKSPVRVLLPLVVNEIANGDPRLGGPMQTFWLAGPSGMLAVDTAVVFKAGTLRSPVVRDVPQDISPQVLLARPDAGDLFALESVSPRLQDPGNCGVPIGGLG